MGNESRLIYGNTGHRVYIHDPTDGHRIIRDSNRDMLFKWCEENCEGSYWIGMGFGQFELQEDAILFKMTWY